MKASVIVCLFATAALADARAVNVLKAIQVDKTPKEQPLEMPVMRPPVPTNTPPLSPAVTQSDKKFFKKNYPGDKAPKVDILHFKHPYPVVQDSQDYDKDFVKDENSDNGEFKAQSEYDRLRHKVAQLKKDAKAALEKHMEEQKELEEAQKKYNDDLAKRQAAIDKKEGLFRDTHKKVATKKVEKPVLEDPETVTAEVAKAKAAAKSEKPEEKKEKPEEKKEEEKKEEKKVVVAPTIKPKGIDTSAAEQAVAQAAKNLKDCEKELADAQAELRRLTEALGKARIAQVEASEKLKEAIIKQKSAKSHADALHKIYKGESDEYDAALAAYKKQKALYEKLYAELQVAAARVRKLRNAEDPDGGITYKDKSAANFASVSMVVLAAAATWQLA